MTLQSSTEKIARRLAPNAAYWNLVRVSWRLRTHPLHVAFGREDKLATYALVLASHAATPLRQRYAQRERNAREDRDVRDRTDAARQVERTTTMEKIALAPPEHRSDHLTTRTPTPLCATTANKEAVSGSAKEGVEANVSPWAPLPPRNIRPANGHAIGSSCHLG